LRPATQSGSKNEEEFTLFVINITWILYV